MKRAFLITGYILLFAGFSGLMVGLSIGAPKLLMVAGALALTCSVALFLLSERASA